MAGGILASYSWDAGFRDAGLMNAVLASWLRNASLASLLRRDAALVLLIIVSRQRCLRNAGLLGPVYRGACLVSLTRGTSFALAFGKRYFRSASLVNLTFRLPNTNFTCLIWYRRDAGLNFASYLCWTISCSNM